LSEVWLLNFLRSYYHGISYILFIDYHRLSNFFRLLQPGRACFTCFTSDSFEGPGSTALGFARRKYHQPWDPCGHRTGISWRGSWHLGKK
jgi:hypothetical protein